MIAGQMALCRFPLWKECLESLASHVDKVYVRFDDLVGDRRILEEIPAVLGDKLGAILVSKTPWDGWRWREELIRMLDDVKPQVVLSLDEDEKYEDGIDGDISRLLSANRNQLMFKYRWPMPSEDGLLPRTKPLPSKAHVKAYKWKPGLTYRDYKRRARVTGYDRHDYLEAHTKILHYCFWNEALRARKLTEGLDTKMKQKWVKEQSCNI